MRLVSRECSPSVQPVRPSQSDQRRFWWCAAITVTTIFSLILVGGIVRATGAGMGCPDWPTCFGQWIPPTSESQLPDDYQRIYAERGYAETGFNVRKTWTEYLNRLLGVFTGLTIFATVLFSLPYRRREPRVFWFALSGFLLVGVQGWLGSRVVATNLHPGMITIHMLLAQVIVGILIAALVRSARHRYRDVRMDRLPRHFYPVMTIAMVAGLLQLVMGTQVREAVDLIAHSSNYVNRHLWIENLPLIFAIHKYYAIVLVLLNGWLVIAVLNHSQSAILRRLCIALAAFLAGTIAIGMSMDRLHLPLFSQPLHLLLASLIFGTQLAILLIIRQAMQDDWHRSAADTTAHGGDRQDLLPDRG
ncbi:MAG: COX15/CtaA family protein [Granulosicoccus sp.]|nr:COX15/CtaA family protein [Granulosicoccus sp.]